MNEIRIAILMSTYNGEKYIKEQIDSLLNQLCHYRIDIYIRDDGSKDRTDQIIESYHNSNIYYFKGENLKPAKSFLKLAYEVHDYDFYAFCDQDDYWNSDKIENGVTKILKYSDRPCIYFSNAKLVDSEMNDLNEVVYKKNPKVNFYSTTCCSNILGCTMIMNKLLVDIFQRHSFPNVVMMHDSYMAKLCLSINGTIIFDSKTQMLYRQHSNNVIGIKRGFKAKFKNRLSEAFTQTPVSFADQAKELLTLYSDVIPEQNKKWLEYISNYRNSFWTRLKLACSFKTKYYSLNVSIKNRLAILNGKR